MFVLGKSRVQEATTVTQDTALNDRAEIKKELRCDEIREADVATMSYRA